MPPPTPPSAQIIPPPIQPYVPPPRCSGRIAKPSAAQIESAAYAQDKATAKLAGIDWPRNNSAPTANFVDGLTNLFPISDANFAMYMDGTTPMVLASAVKGNEAGIVIPKSYEMAMKDSEY